MEEEQKDCHILNKYIGVRVSSAEPCI